MASVNEQVAHVWRRLGFGPNQADMATGINLGPQALITNLLNRSLTTNSYWQLPAMNTWEESVTFLNRLWTLMATSTNPLQERMAWSMMGTLVVAYTDTVHGPEMADHVKRLRGGCLGSYHALLSSVVQSTPMQLYLSNVFSTAEHPNENLARELCELFSLGVTHPKSGAKNYIEGDVKEIARAITGYDFNWNTGQAFFDADYWDAGNKTVFGVNRGAAKFTEVLEAVRTHPSFGYYVPRRIYRLLTGLEPNAATLDQLAAAWGANGDLKALVSHIANRAEFLSDAAIRSRVKCPLELIIGAVRVLGLQSLDRFYFDWALTLMRQHPFEAPNVNGWPDGPAWLYAGQVMEWSGTINGLCFSDDGSASVPTAQRCPTVRQLFQQGSRTTGGDLALQLACLYDVSTETREALRDYANAGPWEIWRACGLMQLALSCPEFLLN